MAEISMIDPDVYRESVPVDDRGRVVVGKALSGKKVRISVEVVDDE